MQKEAQQAGYLHARASEMDFELFISEAKTDQLYGIQGTYDMSYQYKRKNKKARIRKHKHARKNKPLM